jgi:hypothetical protein
MLSSKLYLLLTLLFIFVICSISIEQKSRKSDSALDAKKNTVDANNDDNRRRIKFLHDDDEEDDVDDHLVGALSYADNRYSPFNAPEGNYRTRARWPAQSSSAASSFLLPPPPPPTSPSSSSPFDDFINGNDWSRLEYPNIFSSSLPSTSYDSNPMLSSAPSCNSLVDSQYPIFSDVCGAVPQARYSLPNSFGHRERWQVAQILSALISSSSDSSCTRSLRLLLCPVLFPPCPSRHEPPAVLPCQSYCRAVKARCAIPTLDLLPCEVLPYSSDLCPTNQAYGSFIPPGAYPPVNQPPPMNNGFPSSNYPAPRSYSSLQSLLSSQGLQSTLAQSPLQSAPQPSSAAPANPFNGSPYASDSLNPMLVDFASRSYNNDYRQAPKYAPLPRSSSETRPATDLRPKTETQSYTAHTCRRPVL